MSLLEDLHRQHILRQYRLNANYIPAFLPKRHYRRQQQPEWPKRGWHKIVSEVCEKHGVAIRDVMDGKRKSRVVRCRWEIMWRMRQEVLVGGAQISLPEIGRRLRLHHTTVLYGLRRYAESVRP